MNESLVEAPIVDSEAAGAEEIVAMVDWPPMVVEPAGSVGDGVGVALVD